jgi:hypothetical protein
MSLKFKTKVDTRLGDSNDAMSVLKTAINNGQARLAMEILVDVLDGIVKTLEGLQPQNVDTESSAHVSESNKNEEVVPDILETSLDKTITPTRRKRVSDQKELNDTEFDSKEEE